jgi:Holliday junction resolvase RusA-like endonuclease
MIEGEPLAWARAARNGKFSFTPRAQAVYMDVIRLAARREYGDSPPLQGPLAVRANFIFPWPKSWSEKKRRRPGAHWKISRSDIDNLYKIIGDALGEVVWRDDAQVADLRVTKQYGLSGATYISVEPLTDEGRG